MLQRTVQPIGMQSKSQYTTRGGQWSLVWSTVADLWRRSSPSLC